MGTIYAVGFGPGEKEYMTLEAIAAIERADFVVGYTTYVELLKKQFPKKKYFSTPMRQEAERCRMAIKKAAEGSTVAIISSGDSGIYGMAGILIEVANEMHANVEIIPVAGVTAASAAAAALGAPLMHDFAVISLSDLLTPLELIYRRISCAAEGDFVICLYNPKSRKRTEHLKHAADRIMTHRRTDTPVGIVRNAGRTDMTVRLSTLEKLAEEPVDMFCVVLVGNSQTYIKNGKMITPRGYQAAQRL